MERKTSRAIDNMEIREMIGDKNIDLENVLQVLLKYKEEGKAVSYRFNGFKLESQKISPDNLDEIRQEYRNATSETLLSRELYEEEIRSDNELKRGNFTIQQAVNTILKYKEKGEKVYYIFNGFELNTEDFNSLDEALELYDLYFEEENKQNSFISVKSATENALKSGISKEEILKILNAQENLIEKGVQEHYDE